MNGKALCLMTMEMFCQRVPLGGKMLYKDFQLRLSMALYGNSNSNQFELIVEPDVKEQTPRIAACRTSVRVLGGKLGS